MARERTASQVIGREGAAAFNAEQRAKQPRQRTLSEMATPVGPASDPNAPSRIGSVLRGAMVRGGELIDAAGQIAYNASLAPDVRRGQPMDVGGLDQEAGSAAAAIGARTATDRLGRELENAGAFMLEAAPFAPMAAAGAARMGINPVLAALTEMGAAGIAGMGSQALGEDQHPYLAMAAGAISGGASGPAAGVATTARRGAARAIDTVRLMTPEARAMARANDLTPGAMVRGSGEIKRSIPDVAATIDEIRRRSAQFDSMPHQPSSRQIVEGMEFGRGGGQLTAMERRLLGSDKDYERESALRFADNAQELSRRWEEISPADPDFNAFLADYDAGFEAVKATERGAWRTVREGEQPTFEMGDVIDDAAGIVRSRHFTAADVPSPIRILIDPDQRLDTMDLPRFQELRSSLLGVVRDARLDPTSSKKNAAAMAEQVLERMNAKMDEFGRLDATGKSAEWVEARRLTLETNSLYNPNSPIIRTLESGGQSKNVFATLRNAKGRRGARTTPAQEATRLVRIAEQTPGGMENLRALATEDLFADGFNAAATRTPDRILRQNEEMYRVILGDSYDQALELLEMSRIATRGGAGSASDVYRTGSGVGPAAFLFGIAKAARNPVDAAVEGSMKLMGKTNARELEWQRVVRTAIENPQFLRVLLEMPTARTLPAWQVQWRQLVVQSSARAAAREGIRRSTSEKGVTQ